MHRKYCKNCGFSTDDMEYNFCPKCSSKLIYGLNPHEQELFDKFSREYVMECENCNEYFQKNYRKCPYCQGDLVKKDLFSIDFEKSQITSEFMELNLETSFEDLLRHYFQTHWTMFPPGSPPPEHEIYESTLNYVDEYFMSDLSKYCRRCNKKRKSKLKKCPDCGDELVDFKESESLLMVKELCEKEKVKRCDSCLDEYPLDFKYCPSCANPLKEESQFWIDEKNMLIKTYWNKKEISMPIDEYYKQEMSIAFDAPLPVNMVRLKLHFKEKYDEYLEKSFSRMDLKAPSPLTYPQMKKLVSSLNNFITDGFGFMNREMIRMNFSVDLDELNERYPNIFVIELRKDLFYVYYCRGPVMWGK